MSTSLDTRTASLASRRGKLSRGRLPMWAPVAVVAVSVVLSLAFLTLLKLNTFGFALLTAVFFVLGMYVSSRIVEGPRKATDRLAKYLIWGCFIVALLPLLSLLWTVVQKGAPALFTEGFLSTSMAEARSLTDRKSVTDGEPIVGGVYHAMAGTLLITLWATIISVPIGLLTAVYLVEYGQGKKLSRAITFFVDVMTGIPSIVAGLFATALFGVLLGPEARMGIIASVALSVLMIPVVVRSTEEMLKVVPNELREASYALGVRKWRTIMKVVIPTSISGIASGVTLAVARVIGETAPILVTAGISSRINLNVFSDWMMSLPVYIYSLIQTPVNPNYPAPSELRAWGAALVLIIAVMALNLISRLIAKFFAPKGNR